MASSMRGSLCPNQSTSALATRRSPLLTNSRRCVVQRNRPTHVHAAAEGITQREYDGKDFAIATASILNDTKCNDIVVLDVSPLASWTSYMVFCGVYSKPQLLAAMSRVEKMAAEDFDKKQQNISGNSPWECLDFGDCVVHIMSIEQREYYDVESFYATAEEVVLPFDQEPASPEMQPPKWTREQAESM